MFSIKKILAATQFWILPKDKRSRVMRVISMTILILTVSATAFAESCECKSCTDLDLECWTRCIDECEEDDCWYDFDCWSTGGCAYASLCLCNHWLTGATDVDDIYGSGYGY